MKTWLEHYDVKNLLHSHFKLGCLVRKNKLIFYELIEIGRHKKRQFVKNWAEE
jgi:hypothetical protein